MSNLFCVSLVIVLVITVVSCDKNTGNTDQNTEPTNALEKYSSTFGKKINSRTREAPNRENKAKVMPSVVPIETPKRDKNRSRQRSSNQSTTPTAPARSSIPTPKPIKSRNSATESTARKNRNEIKSQYLLSTPARPFFSITTPKPRSTAKPTKPLARKERKSSKPNVPAIDNLLSFEFPTAYPKPIVANLIANMTKNRNTLVCPKDGKREFQWFPLICQRSKDCQIWGKNYRCCKDSNGLSTCVKGIQKPLPEPAHSPILGVVPVKCPKTPLAELFWDLQTCESDKDCWPRVCCPDGRKKYCRSAKPEFRSSSYPIARQLATPFESMTSYIQCTPPPSNGYDFYPKPCNSTLDCFPNLCCQEAGKRFCRPPARSLLAFLTTSVSDRIQNSIFRG